MSYEALTITSSGIAKSILLPVIVGQAETLCQRFNIPSNAVDIYALLDTGASATCISKALAERLGLKVIGECMMNTASGLRETHQYLIDLTIQSNVSFANIRAAEFTGNKNFDILLGMDILMLGDLAITNAEQRTVISFRVPPDTQHIDYVKQ